MTIRKSLAVLVPSHRPATTVSTGSIHQTPVRRDSRARTAIVESLKPRRLIAALACAGLVSPACALDMMWFGGTGAWELGTNWSPIGPPTSGDRAVFSAGFATLSSNRDVGALAMSGGTLGGASNLTVLGLTSLTAGQIGGNGGQVIANGGLVISGNSDKTLGANGGAVSSGIVNNGLATWSGTGNVSNWSSGRFTNSAGASLDIQTDADFFSGTFMNQGSLTKSIGAGGTGKTQVTSSFSNSGSVNVQQGTLEVLTPFSNQGVVSVQSGALFQGNNASFENAGALQGNGTIQTAAGQTLNNTGVLSPGNSIGRLTIDGNLRSSGLGSVKFELASLASFDVLAVTGAVTLGGDIGVWDFGYDPVVGDTFVVMTFNQRLNDSRFASITLHGFDAGTAFEVTYRSNDVILGVVGAVPEPHTYLLMLGGLGMFATMARHRRKT